MSFLDTDTYKVVASITSRVRKPNKYDWGKIVHLMKYIKGMIYLPLILIYNVSVVLNWSIDGSYSV